MKKLILVLLFSLASVAQAADFRVTEGFIYWHTNAQSKMATELPGIGSYRLELDKKTLRDTSNAFYFVALEHPVPVVPNIRLAYTALNHKGKGSWQVDSICNPCAIKGGVDLSHVDISPYYKVVNNRWLSLDLGLTARIFVGDLSGEGTSGAATGVKFKSAIDSTYGLIFAELQFHVSDTGLSFGSLLNAGGSNKEKATDIDTYLVYASPIGVGFKAGYRYLDIDLASDAKFMGGKVKLQTDMQVTGPYLGLYLRF